MRYPYYSATLLRIVFGLLFLSAGWSKIVTGNWSAAGYLANATGPFASWFQAMAGSAFVDQLNMWGLTLLGVSLVLGIFVRPAAILGGVLMLLYYFAGFEANTAHGLIDEHIIYILALISIAAAGSAGSWGLDGYLKKIVKVKCACVKWLFG